jgi:hypothetical protein
MKQRVAHVDDWKRGLADDDAPAGRAHQSVRLLIRVGDDADHLPLAHGITDALGRPQHAAFRRADPFRRVGKHWCAHAGRGGRRLKAVRHFQHADRRHHARDPVHASLDRELVEPQPLATLVNENVDPGILRGLSQRARSFWAFQHHLRTERQSKVTTALTGGIRTSDLRQVHAMHGGGMQVDADLAALDHFIEQQMRQTRA